MSRIRGMAVLHSVYSSIKKTLRSTQLAPLLYRSIRRVVASGEEITHLSQLIEQNQMVVLKPWFQMKRNETGRMIVQKTVKDYLDVCRAVWLRKDRADQLAVPPSAVLLRYPLALLAIPSTHEEYLKSVGPKTRNMIRKAEKAGYHFGELNWNDHLDEIFEINTSKEVRSAGEMRGWYREPVQPRYHSNEEQCYQKYYGIFKEGRLWAYLNLVLCGDFAYFKHFLGHADHLKSGIMNYLVSRTVWEYVRHAHVKWLSYGMYPAGSTGSTIDFRRHAGFEGYAAFFDLEGDQELLKYSKRVRARGLTSI